jgi:hypothetical protein
MLDKQRQVVVDTLDALDAEAVDWVARRRKVLSEALDIHEQLWPRLPGGWARRPPRPDQAPLPPTEHDAFPLRGVELRAVCLRLLIEHGLLALRELHVLLHLYGFIIGTSTPVKSLADALGYETRAGRADRVERGWYRARADRVPGRPDPVLRSAPEDWYPGAAARLRSAPSAQRPDRDPFLAGFDDDAWIDGAADERQCDRARRARDVADLTTVLEQGGPRRERDIGHPGTPSARPAPARDSTPW